VAAGELVFTEPLFPISSFEEKEKKGVCVVKSSFRAL
jgi:hypothetical protein